MRRLPWLTAAALVIASPTALAAQTPAAVQATAEDARLYAFLDNEFAEQIRDRP